MQDDNFYSASRFVTHIDDNAIEKLTQYYGSLLPRDHPCSILDLCGSWISHLPLPLPEGTRVDGLGLNKEELERNPAYSAFKVFDLNASKDQKWEWLKNESFDLVICTVSIDYLIYPLEVLRECLRILKPGNLCMYGSNTRWRDPSDDLQSLFPDESNCVMAPVE
jgi:SAM-dependent methyltransferase